jgi:hypothetical protein
MKTDIYVNFTGGGKGAPSGKHQINSDKNWSIGREGKHTVMRFYRVDDIEETVVLLTDGLGYSIINRPRR